MDHPLTDHPRMLRFHSDDVILRQGSTEKYLYKLISGTVALYFNYGQKNEYLLGLLNAPEFFGELTILTDRPQPYTVVAFEEVTVVRVTEQEFPVFIQGNYQNALLIMRDLARAFTMLQTNTEQLLGEMMELFDLQQAKNADQAAIRSRAQQILERYIRLDENNRPMVMMKV